MLKGLSNLWWRGVKRLNKAQQSQSKKLVKKLVKTLLASPPKRSRAKTSSPKPATSKAAIVRTVVAKPTTSETPKRLPGKWLSGYYNAFPGDGRLPVRRMRYWLYLPDRDSTSGLPLVVMLHGCDQTATEFAEGTRMNRLAEEKGFAVLYPQQSLRGHPMRCWPWFEKSIQNGGGDVQLIAGTIRSEERRVGKECRL